MAPFLGEVGDGCLQTSESLPTYPQNVSSVPEKPLGQNAVAWMLPTPIDTPITEMRQRYQRDGYLLVKGLLDRKAVLDMREFYFTYLDAEGLLKPGSSPRDGIYNADIDPTSFCGIGSGKLPQNSGAAQRVVKAHQTPEYLQFLDRPQLRKFVRDFMDWKRELLYNRTLLRYSVPGAPSTGVHYDKIFLRGADSEFLTAWIPLGDIASNGGGLVYLEDSGSLGEATEKDFNEKACNFSAAERINPYNVNMMEGGFLSDDLEEFQKRESVKGRKWLTSNFEAGDVVFHKPYIVHAASMNFSKDGRIRLSTDVRFADADGDIDKRWINFWDPDDKL